MGESRSTRLGNYVLGPEEGTTFRSNTSTSQVAIDLSTYANRVIAVTAFTQPCGVMLAATANTTDHAISLSATSGITQCGEIPANATMCFFVRSAKAFMHTLLASSTGYVRIVVISPPEDVS